jgi:hypothetical protein
MRDFETYQTIKFLIEAGKIKTIRDIFRFIPKTAVLKDFRINFGRFNNALADPSRFKLSELRTLARLFDVDPRLMVDMAYEQMAEAARRKKRK